MVQDETGAYVVDTSPIEQAFDNCFQQINGLRDRLEELKRDKSSVDKIVTTITAAIGKVKGSMNRAQKLSIAPQPHHRQAPRNRSHSAGTHRPRGGEAPMSEAPKNC